MLEERVAQLEKGVAELREAAQPEKVWHLIKSELVRHGVTLYDPEKVENPKVAFEKVLPSGKRAIFIDGPPSAVGKFISMMQKTGS